MSRKPMLNRDDLEELHDRGLTAREIADALGCDIRTVSRWRVRYGITESKTPVQRGAEDLARFEAMLDDGWSFREIVRTEHTTYDYLMKHFPGRGWSLVECGRYGWAIKKLGGAA